MAGATEVIGEDRRAKAGRQGDARIRRAGAAAAPAGLVTAWERIAITATGARMAAAAALPIRMLCLELSQPAQPHGRPVAGFPQKIPMEPGRSFTT